MKKRKKFFWFKVVLAEVVLSVVLFYVLGYFLRKDKWKTPDELISVYMEHIQLQEYKEMYAMLDIKASGGISSRDFIKRNPAIYQGIRIRNMKTEILAYNENQMSVEYKTTFDTDAGNISFTSEAGFTRSSSGYKLIWNDSLIFPGLCSLDKVQVSVIKAKRGKILDRNGYVIARQGTVSVAGVVPGKLKNKKKAIRKIARLLHLELNLAGLLFLQQKGQKSQYFLPAWQKM